MRYFRFRRGVSIHFERKSDDHRTWLVCGKVRLTHRLYEVDEKIVESNIIGLCTPCLLGMTKRAFETYKMDMMVEQIAHSDEMHKHLMKDLIKKLDIIDLNTYWGPQPKYSHYTWE